MDRVLLRRDRAAVVATACTDDGTPGALTVLPAGELPGWVAAREAAGPVRWVWDDTTRWYPALLDAGVRVQRCTTCGCPPPSCAVRPIPVPVRRRTLAGRRCDR